jgi:uncharacterized membrane protein (DUF485 family)
MHSQRFLKQILYFSALMEPKQSFSSIYKLKLFVLYVLILPISVAVWSKAWVCGRSIAGFGGSNLVGGVDDSLL